jgi:SAM-dependent methyltransferase
LSVPFVYEAYEAAVGQRKARRIFVQDYIRPFLGARVLDLACGPAGILEYFPRVHYVGVDLSEAYVRRARRRYADLGTFFVGDATNVEFAESARFDIIVALGLLHHVDDRTARSVCLRATAWLKKGGRFVTLDPCFVEGQSRFARFLHEKDRGSHVRAVDAYLRIVNDCFNRVDHDVRHDLHRIPSTTLIMTCVA